MKTTLVCMLLLFIPVAVRAGESNPADWYWALIAGANMQNSDTWGGVGVAPGATDGYDGDLSNDWQIVTGSRAYLGAHHINNVDNWNGHTGFYSSDTRAPLPLQIGASKTWAIYVWADPTLSTSAAWIALNWTNYHALPENLSYSMTLVSKPVGVIGGPATGTVWNLTTQPVGGVQLPVFRTTNGLDGYMFDFTATVIPEPASILTILCGLAGMGGMAWRRIR